MSTRLIPGIYGVPTVPSLLWRNLRAILVALAVLCVALGLWQYHRMGKALIVQQKATQEAVAALKTQQQAAAGTDAALSHTREEATVRQRDAVAAEKLTKEVPREWQEAPLPAPARAALCRAWGMQDCPEG